MIKLSNWEYFKFILLISIISSVMIMRKYNNYGSKGEYILSEHGAEAQTYFNDKNIENNKNIIPITSPCNKNCAKDCMVNAKTNKLDIIQCLDSCACNNEEIIPNKEAPSYNGYFTTSTWIIFLGIVITASLVTCYKEESDEYFTYALHKLKLIKDKKEKNVYDAEEIEVDNEYTKLTDI